MRCRSSLRRALAVTAALALVASSCSDDDAGDTDDPPAATVTTDSIQPPASEPATAEPAEDEPSGDEAGDADVDDTPMVDPALVSVRPGTEQITVTGANPGARLQVVADGGEPVASDIADEFGALLFRQLAPGTTFTVAASGYESVPVTTFTRDDHPDASFFADQEITAPGFGYLTTRDGTTLSVTVWLPGPVDEGPYPTVVEYSGYSPSNPDSSGFGDIFTALGYAYVGVNMRGTGCSGGSFRYFEYTQSLDGYDAVEAIAAQPWVQDNTVGMVGISYPGISQLFVAQTQPPSLVAITPLSVLDDSFNANLYPGGILNTGFAVSWTQDRVDESRPEGQPWAADRIAAGDHQCAENQQLRLQNPDLLAEIVDSPFWVSPLGDELAPRTFVDRIEVPVFLAGAWQDEQTGGRFPTMLDRFTSSPAVYASLVNGLHTEAISPSILPRYVEFLDLYVARRTPSAGVLQAIGPILGGGIFGTTDFEIAGDRFTGMSFDDALAAFESEPPVQVLFEQGAADGRESASPMARFVESFDAWPIPEAVPTEWYLTGGVGGVGGVGSVGSVGGLASSVSTANGDETSYLALPDGLPATFYEGSSSAIWRTDVAWDWLEPAPGTAASFVTEPLTADTVVVGSGSVDLWVRSNLGDTDLEVTVSEVRPDGTETYVQSGWLRASRRALDEAASTPLRPVHTHLESDAAPLPDDTFELVRIEVYPFAHPFRAGSQLRLTVDAPGNSRAVWAFDTIAGGEQVTIAHDAEHPSKLVLAVVPDVVVPPGVAACGALRGQPCRPSSPSN
ncbi:hypothetical protein BH23ACT3_BH23ACT3_19550 [soil metagenome]